MGVPYDYQRRIASLIPVALMNSDAEKEQLAKDIQNLYR
jgi:hypothetical protein